jgi:hypothetical protein
MLLALKLGDDCLRPRLVLDCASKDNRLNVGRSDGAAGDVVVVEKLKGEVVFEARVVMARCQSGLHPLQQQGLALLPLRHRLDTREEIGVVAYHMHRGTPEAERDLDGSDELASYRLAAVRVFVALENHYALLLHNVPEEVGAVAAALHCFREGVLPIPHGVLREQLTIRPFFELSRNPDLVDVRVCMRSRAACFAHCVGHIRNVAAVAVGAHEIAAARFAFGSFNLVNAV